MNSKTKLLTLTALFTAMVCVTTAFILHIPTANGYIHIGDSIIYLASVILPFPCGMIAGALGGGLSDLLSGYPAYILPTVIIKSLNSFCIYAIAKNEKNMFSVKSVIASIVSGIVTIVGYYITAVILYGNPQAQLVEAIPNVIQAVASAIIFWVLAFALDKARIPAINSIRK